MTYRVLTNSRRVEKAFLQIITGFNEEEQQTMWQILQTHPKGSAATHWTIKKVYRDIWQLDLPRGYRLEYTALDTDRVVLVLFIGNHDDAAAYLRGKKITPYLSPKLTSFSRMRL